MKNEKSTLSVNKDTVDSPGAFSRVFECVVKRGGDCTMQAVIMRLESSNL